MKKEINVKGIKWIEWTGLNNFEINEIIKKYNFHELDIEACMEENQRARIDSYDDYIFMVLHFPKYDAEKKVYNLNEFNIFLGKDFLITFREYEWKNIDKIFENYKNKKIDNDKDFKVSSGYILYEIIQSMLEKMFKFIDNIRKDLKQVEWLVFDRANTSLVKEIMIKKRNIVVMKHMLIPEVSVMKYIELKMNEMFRWEMEEYFEDLEDKISKVVNDIKILEEYLDSIEDAFKTIIDIKTNSIMTFLTLFSAFFLPLTLITSFYWMNITLPFQDNPMVVHWIIIFITILMIVSYIFFKKKTKFF